MSAFFLRAKDSLEANPNPEPATSEHSSGNAAAAAAAPVLEEPEVSDTDILNLFQKYNLSTGAPYHQETEVRRYFGKKGIKKLLELRRKKSI